MAKSSSQGNDSSAFRCVLNNEPAEVVRLSQWLNQTVAPTLQLSQKLTFQLDLVLEEALTNVIHYAFDTAAPQQITVSLRAAANTISVQIIDNGRPFDPLHEHQVKLAANLHEAGQGGLGLHLIRSYTQTRHYERKDGQNIFTMIFDRQIA